MAKRNSGNIQDLNPRAASVTYVLTLAALITAAGCTSISRNPASSGERRTVFPRKISSQLHNPGMGFVFYCGNSCGANIPDEADVLYTSNLTWGDVEPSPGQYNFSRIQNILATARKTNRRIAIRVMTSFQDTDHPTPAWLTDSSLGGTVPLLNDAEPNTLEKSPSFIFEPEWWSPDYGPAFRRMVGALGRAFDGEPLLDYVDIRVYGWWNEGHRFHATIPWPSKIDKRQFIIDQTHAYLKAFLNTPLVVETASDAKGPPMSPKYPTDTGIDWALQHGTWMRRDGFGGYISDAESQLLQSNWKKSLVIAEAGGQYANFLAGKILNRQRPSRSVATIDECISEMLEHHINYFPLNGLSDFQVLKRARPDLLKRALSQTGYRFEVTKASWESAATVGSTVAIRLTWHNAGVGRLPFPHFVSIFLLDQNEHIVQQAQDRSADMTSLINGTDLDSSISLLIPHGISEGAYKLAVALLDPKTLRPAIALGIEGNRGSLLYDLGEINIQ